ncbi:DNA cytosine methyltransferase [Candidatus Poriferisodalis sp.]|uniref:DNA cytosine methyltransferase n=1 Tax=Candidatus Poriferisodalis sp. TaxID=3101277 RepID=UPI003B5C9DCB
MGTEALGAVSLFSNCGAGDVGYARAGFSFRIMAEIEQRRLAVALANHKEARGVPGDLRNTWREVIASFRSEEGPEPPALLSACPPCQGMSTARGGRGREEDAAAGSRDGRNLLVEVIALVANGLRPRLVVVENVAAFLSRLVLDPRNDELAPISAAVLLRELLEPHYECYPFLTDLADYGVPQRRVRAFMTFVRRDEPTIATLARSQCVPYPKPIASAADGNWTSLKEALTQLDVMELDAASYETAHDPTTPMHAVPVWGSDHRYRMVAAIPPNSGGRAWDTTHCEAKCDAQVGADDAVCPTCNEPLLRPVVQEVDGSYRLVRGFRRSSYSRMRPDAPAPTITTASGHVGSDNTIHPFENRLLSPHECAHLQTIPQDFDWGNSLDDWGATAVRAMIGEAVPPRFTEMHGCILAALLEGQTEGLTSVNDQRLAKAVERMQRGLPGQHSAARS